MVLEGLFGVITGLLGTGLTSFTNLKMQKLKNEHDIALVRAETEAMKAEAEANIKITETQVQGELAMIEEQNFGKVLEAGNKPVLSNQNLAKLFEHWSTAIFGTIIVFLLGIVEFLRTFMRPGLTAYLVILTSWITWYSADILSAKAELLSATEASGLFLKVVEIVIYLTVSSVTWWFADRRVAKFLYRLNDGNLR